MLDENLPTFYLKPGQEAIRSILLCQYGNDPDPAYSLRYPNPASTESKNRYAAALYDPYVPDIVYGEVLIVPEWTRPTLSAEAIRQNGGVAPPPEPILPTRFTIQLYSPDQQIEVQYKPKTWNSPATWTFEMPQHSFREPTGSSLDRTQVDPSASDITPKLRFSWRKDSKLSKDLTCLLSGKTTAIPETKAKSKEPDITISIFKGLREMTLYEPNLYRVEMEDFKGLEVVLLLGAITIRDVYFTAPKDAFRVSNPPSASNSPTSTSPTTVTPTMSGPPPGPVAVRTDVPPAHPPIESPQHRRQLEQQRKEEERRTKKMLEDEEKARRKEEEKVRRKRQAEVDKETRRLQKLYGEEERKARAQTPAMPPRQPTQQPTPPAQPPRQQQYYHHHQHPPVSHGGSRPYTQLPVQGSTATLAPPRPHLNTNPSLQPKRSSFFGLRRTSDDGKLTKKRSSMF